MYLPHKDQRPKMGGFLSEVLCGGRSEAKIRRKYAALTIKNIINQFYDMKYHWKTFVFKYNLIIKTKERRLYGKTQKTITRVL